ncbi:alkaline phosphatase family protein [Bacillus sp. DX1.1]|uniref:alkaline phosphatase family protein n=1 Tax=unclassified Bacillus (in: firmicutes) TaxID=185979 RepID=UPI0025709CCD|nr:MULTISPECIES: alkaline phosphatase family protein [unclassified Bacillus (in: firmicutes)]MDM5156698.1 alkaline phosphatase family protein [Bacillus sp. DX1.1]WJE80953.1 alkaline phosphatase family protein [Bacillus sp. DX3.1]
MEEVKKASKFEKVAARCWNLLNEGKPFTPIFVFGTFLLFSISQFGQPGFVPAFFSSFVLIVPLLVLYYLFDFPLFLRNYLWFPFVAYLIVFKVVHLPLFFFALGLYFFFTILFWGTLYYHLRIGTSWLNFTRFWKLVLKNSDSTSGNAQEQMPKFLLLLSLWYYYYDFFQEGGTFSGVDWRTLLIFYGALLVYTLILHRNLFDWQPKAIASYTENMPENQEALNEKVVVIVIDGMRKDRFEAAHTPYLDSLRKQGTEFLNMETVYPARTVVCFSSMFTGTYSFEHGIKSNMVWKHGVNVESIFDSLRKVDKTGKMLAVAHLVDAFGDDVETFTAVMKNDVVDSKIMEKARKIMDEQDPDLFIVQLISTDQTGHSRGVLYDEYLQKIHEADQHVKQFIEHLEKTGKAESTTFIICADHGQADGIGGHGHLDEGERFVPFFMYGPHIAQGIKVEEKKSLVSMAPTIAYLLGAPYPSHSRGPVLVEALKEQEKK